jgi:hypothetical protein
MWQPSLSSLRNVEEDEAGRLRAFRERFGRGWDSELTVEAEDSAEEKSTGEESLMDLISGYTAEGATEAASEKKGAGEGKGKGGRK